MRDKLMHQFQVDNYEEAKLRFLSKLRCSALIKTLYNEKGLIDDVYIGHATWDSYSSLLRSFKSYKFAKHGAN
jgi:hypothetical protein